MLTQKNLKINLTFLLLVLAIGVNAQTKQFKFKREITGVDSLWHSMKLPDDLYKNTKSGFDDLRIFGIKGKDTVEVPYLLKQLSDKTTTADIAFKQINQSNNSNGYYYTFQAEGINTINQIGLNFKQQNFDWKIDLEGSSDNSTWFSILKDYRILSIKNNDTDYQFTKLSFTDAKYRYFRLSIKSDQKPELLEAKITKTDTLKGTYQNVNYQSFNLINDAKSKETIIEVSLRNAVPLSYLKLNAQSDFDFYRSFKIECATDSFKTDRGMEYNYATLYNGTLSSLEKAEFNFENTITGRFKITIKNNDNKPLRISNLLLRGNIYQLVARFDAKDYNYALFYGNDKATVPSYEIEKFESKIPTNLSAINIGNEEKNPAYSVKIEQPLFENKNWLWALMAVIIILLGWFSFKMLKN